MNSDIASRIKTIIDHYGLSVSAFADVIGVQRSSISHLLNGRNKPSLDFVMKLVDAYPEVDLYWLLQGKGGFPSDELDTTQNSPAPKTENGQKKVLVPKELSAHAKSKQDVKTDELEKIVFFYPDGTFTTFKSKND